MTDTDLDELARAMLRQVAAGAASLTPAPSELAQIEATVQAYLVARQTQVKGQTLKRVERRIRRVLQDQLARAQAAGRPLEFISDLRLDDVNAYARDRVATGAALGTLSLDLIAVRAMVRWAIKTKRVATDPLEGLDMPPKGRRHQSRPRARYNADQLSALLASAQIMDERRVGKAAGARSWKLPQYHSLLILIRTAVRVSEMRTLIWGDMVRLQDGWAIRVRTEDAKAGGDRFAPLFPPDVDELLNLRQLQAQILARTVREDDRMLRAPRGGFLVQRNYSRWFEEVRKASGIPKQNERGEVYCIHSLRHATLDGLAQANRRAAELLAGHTDSRTLDNYLHTDDISFVRTALETLPKLDVDAALKVLRSRDLLPGKPGAQKAENPPVEPPEGTLLLRASGEPGSGGSMRPCCALSS